MKWLPPPSVPICRVARAANCPTPAVSAPKPDQNASQPAVARPWTRRGSTGSSCAWKPTGIAAPTAAGASACRVAMTDPTVASLP
jgi:hypothetical protein